MKLFKFFIVLSFAILFVVLRLPSALPASADSATTQDTDSAYTLQEVVVTAPPMLEPLTVTTDPKAPRQPVPADDGAGYLKNIPGFSVARQGGTGGDPVLRGLGGTRLNILIDGTSLLGGCPMRMDPPTAYIYPESYDKITVLKGPETVLYGGGNEAGTVLFERDTKRFEAPGVRLISSAIFGSFGRNDQMVDLTAGVPQGFFRVIGIRSDSDNYKDGNGNEVHSFYTRRSLTGILGWTPDAHTKLELSGDISDAHAAYAGGNMDGVKFDKEGLSLRFVKTQISPLISSIDFKVYYNYIDHVMDNFTLRTFTPGPGKMAMASNPDRKTYGGRLSTKLVLSQSTVATVGVDYQENKHTVRSAKGMNVAAALAYASLPRTPDMTFKNIGVFGEVEHDLNDKNRIIGGLRTDFLDVDNEKPGNIASDNNTTYGAFLRCEHDYASVPVTSYIGIGHAERPADWWERNYVFFLDPEKNTQLDTGIIYDSKNLRASLSLFYAKINDFIILNPTAKTARNIDATTYGSEADISYSPFKNVTASATLAYVHGQNDTDDKPLPQMPPLEGTLGLKFDNKTVSAGVLFRAVATQDRVDIGDGTEIGTDVSKTSGFGVLSANAAYRLLKGLLIAAGVDNILDKAYAEHISKAGAAVPGFEQTTLVNEPGRTFWVKATYTF
jgi:iron complex outermembrane receptor protein